MPKAHQKPLPARRRHRGSRELPASGEIAHAFVIDDEVGVCRFLTAALANLGLSAEVFHTADEAIAALDRGNPDIIFLDIALGGSDAVDIIRALGARRYRGLVQLMSGIKSALLEDVYRIGALHGLNMCPPLTKPFRSASIAKAIASVSLLDGPEITLSHEPAPALGLEEAIANDWLELWYQPKLDLRTSKMAGVEAVVVCRHPKRGILPADGLLAQASRTTRAALAERFIGETLDDWSDLATVGLGLRVAVAASFDILADGGLMALSKQRRPKSDLWPGLILEISEQEVIQDINLAHEIATQLGIYDVSLAIDNFGAGFSTFERLRELPFSELRLHPGFVAGCAYDEKNAGICRAAIDLAHRFGIVAVASGLESEADLATLWEMGCDVGQGPLFAEPMPKSEFMKAFGERSKARRERLG